MLQARRVIDYRQPGTLLHQQKHRVGRVRPANTDPLSDAAELDALERIDLHVIPPMRKPGAQAGCPVTVTRAPVASVTRAAPNSWPGVHAPGLAPARTRRAVSAAMAAVTRTPSPARSSAVRSCPP